MVAELFKIETSTEINSRREFARLCNARKLWRAVEIGTDRGDFAHQFMEVWEGETLICIDNWEPYEEMPWDRSMDRSLAIAYLAPFAPRLRFIRSKSPEAIALIPSWFSVEFAYIDGSHDRKSVEADLEGCWNRLYPHGPTILAGHDFADCLPGVKAAVTEFAQRHDVTVRVTCEGDTNPSWYIYRNEPDRLCVFRP